MTSEEKIRALLQTHQGASAPTSAMAVRAITTMINRGNPGQPLIPDCSWPFFLILERFYPE
jgi:hypothetical protein